MTSDSLLINIQLAIMGVVLVAGLFYLWRMICKVDKKIDDYIEQSASVVAQHHSSHDASEYCPFEGAKCVDDMDIKAADDFMKEVFGSVQPSIIISSSSSPVTSQTTTAPTITQSPNVEIEEDTTNIKETLSEAETNVTLTHLTKTKIKRMSVEALKDVCKEKGLSTDGTKSLLQERILATIDDNEE